MSRSDCGLLYRDGQAGFLELPNQSRFPRNAFFDTAEHLNEAAQIRHSVAVARALIHMAQRPADVADCRHCARDGGVSDAGTH
ncbi:MAG: hypothetical protein ACJ8AI_11215 [Rhodopila sp.]